MQDPTGWSGATPSTGWSGATPSTPWRQVYGDPEPDPDPDGATALVLTAQDAPALGALLDRLTSDDVVAEILVVASSGGEQAVAAASGRSAGARRCPIRIFAEERRSGKAAAINLGFEQARCARVLLVGGDVMPAPGALADLVGAIERQGVAMAGARVVPIDPPTDLPAFAGHLIWRLHDRVARKTPKLGELVAVRREAFRPLPDTATDEAYLQALTTSAGWTNVYVPSAEVHNRAPRSVRELYRQRRRIHGGHLDIQRTRGFSVPTQRTRNFARPLFGELLRRPRRPMWSLATLLIEASARAGARWDSLRGKELHVWEIIESAKYPPPGSDSRIHGGRSGLAQMGSPPSDADQPDDQR